MLTVRVLLLNGTTCALSKNSKNLLALLEIEVSKTRLFWSANGSYSNMLHDFNPYECGTVITPRTLNVKILLGKSSKPI